MEVSVTQKELEAIEKLENMQISFLEFDSSQNCFAKEVSVDDDDSTVPSMTHSDHCDPQHSQQIYEFCGPNKHQSLLSAQVLLDGRWKDIKMTVDRTLPVPTSSPRSETGPTRSSIVNQSTVGVGWRRYLKI